MLLQIKNNKNTILTTESRPKFRAADSQDGKKKRATPTKAPLKKNHLSKEGIIKSQSEKTSR